MSFVPSLLCALGWHSWRYPTREMWRNRAERPAHWRPLDTRWCARSNCDVTEKLPPNWEP